MSDKTQQAQMEDDEFEKMLDEFLAGSTPDPVDDEKKEETEKAEDDDSELGMLLKDFVDNALNDENEDETTSSEEEDNNEEEDEDEEINLNDFPEGSVEFNEKNTVKVEILKPLKNPRKKLDKLVGCKNIKQQISDLLLFTTYNRCMAMGNPGWKEHSVSLHAIFFGKPGTGKTTVCKIYGSLLREVGALSKGHVVVCNRSTFLGTNWGDEEKAVRQVLEMAEGGVLMIDEAYLLNSPHPNDPGKLVIQLLMEILANEYRRDIAIVLCGYKEPMQQLLDLNAGLASRFPNRFEFADFTVDELMEITLRRMEEYKYHFTRAAKAKYKALLTEAYACRDTNTWGNARFVANLLEHIYLAHAKRCVNFAFANDAPTIRKCFAITPADIQPIEVPKPKPRVGF